MGRKIYAPVPIRVEVGQTITVSVTPVDVNGIPCSEPIDICLDVVVQGPSGFDVIWSEPEKFLPIKVVPEVQRRRKFREE